MAEKLGFSGLNPETVSCSLRALFCPPPSLAQRAQNALRSDSAKGHFGVFRNGGP
jgi:hypothetical protein